MELGEYFGKVFSKIFNKDLFWPQFVLSIICGFVFGALIVIGIVLFGGQTLIGFFLGQNVDIAMMPNVYNSFLSMVSLVIYLAVIGLVSMYIHQVIYCFLISRIPSIEKNTKLEFFEKLGNAFGLGFKLFIAHIIFGLVVALILVIVWFSLFWASILGWIIAGIISLCIGIYHVTGILILTGNIATGKALGYSLARAFVKPVSQFKLTCYSLIFGIILVIALIIFGVLGLIPLLGTIIVLIFGAVVSIYFSLIAYYFAQEQ